MLHFIANKISKPIKKYNYRGKIYFTCLLYDQYYNNIKKFQWTPLVGMTMLNNKNNVFFLQIINSNGSNRRNFLPRDGVLMHQSKNSALHNISQCFCVRAQRPSPERLYSSASKRHRWPTCRSGRQERDCAHFSAPSPAASGLKWRSAISMYLLAASFLSPGRWQIATCFRARLLRAAEAAKWIKVEVAPERLPRSRLCNLLDTAVRRVCSRPRLLQQLSALDHKSLKSKLMGDHFLLSKRRSPQIIE